MLSLLDEKFVFNNKFLIFDKKIFMKKFLGRL